jgi:CRISPR-associated protein Cas5h
MRTLVFDVHGEYGQFKKPYSPMSPVSYPFPPPTAVLGMLGAIIGYEKDDYHEQLGWQKIRIGVGLLAPIQNFRAAINLLQTKDGTDAFFRPRAGQNTHTQVPFEFLKSPNYRIYVAGLSDESAQRLANNLMAGKTAYTVVLGLASCIADTGWLGEWDAQPLENISWAASTVVPLSADVAIEYEEGRRYHRLRVPAVMDGKRIVHRYQEVVLAEDGQAIRGQGGQHLFYEINHETIVFL